MIVCSMVGGLSFLPDLEGHVRKGKVTALAVSAAVLAVGAVAAVAPAGSAATTSAAPLRRRSTSRPA